MTLLCTCFCLQTLDADFHLIKHELDVSKAHLTPPFPPETREGVSNSGALDTSTVLGGSSKLQSHQKKAHNADNLALGGR